MNRLTERQELCLSSKERLAKSATISSPSFLLFECFNCNLGIAALLGINYEESRRIVPQNVPQLDANQAGSGRAAYGLSKGVTGAQQIAITAHEIGHNLGATHPNQQVPPVADCNNTVMSSSVSVNPQLLFCQFSVDEISR